MMVTIDKSVFSEFSFRGLTKLKTAIFTPIGVVEPALEFRSRKVLALQLLTHIIYGAFKFAAHLCDDGDF